MIIRPFPFDSIGLTHPYLQLKVEVRPKEPEAPIQRAIDYGLGGFAIRRGLTWGTYAPGSYVCTEDNALSILTQGYMSKCDHARSLSIITQGYMWEIV